MERLLADAEKLSGVHYDIDNLGDVYAGIHVIQENLGLTGVAAEEASETFSGSMNAMKASAQNVLANLALGEDISIVPTKQYIAFKRNTNVCDIQTQKGQVKVTINIRSGELSDPKGIAKDMEKPQHIGHWGNGDYELIMTDLNDIDYIMELIGQSYKVN